MLLQCIAGFALAAVGMMIAFGLVRWAANLLIITIGLSVCVFVVYQIIDEAWIGWLEICLYAFLSGGAGAVLSLPVLPFSSFSARK